MDYVLQAPGSKTVEILDLMHRDDVWQEIGAVDPTPQGAVPHPPQTHTHAPQTPRGGGAAQGVLVCNDSDARRVNNVLLPRLRKWHSPCILSTITNGAKFPLFSEGDAGTTTASFDRVLVDAPCSGDGTIRKHPSIWRQWKALDGFDLHGKQVKLLTRAVALVRVGGRVVYSTCSLNPLENEAVVSAVLRKFGGRVVLENGDELTPAGLRVRPGLTTWKVPNPKYWGRLAKEQQHARNATHTAAAAAASGMASSTVVAHADGTATSNTTATSTVPLGTSLDHGPTSIDDGEAMTWHRLRWFCGPIMCNDVAPTNPSGVVGMILPSFASLLAVDEPSCRCRRACTAGGMY